MPTGAPRYIKPGRVTRHVFNPLVAVLTRLGIGFWGARVLEVRGRRSGEWRAVPVNLLTVGEHRYLVAPRGETEWVKNLRAAHSGRLTLGRKVSHFQATELDDAAKIDVLRPYLRRWRWEVGQFFDGVGHEASDHELAAIAPNHPIFRIQLI